jgi:aromatic-L-amino-acid decarboxylase
MFHEHTSTGEQLRSGCDMPPESFRQHGKDLVDWIANYLDDARGYPVVPQCQPGELLRRLPPVGPASGESMDVILRDFRELVLPLITHWNHPRFHGYFSISSSAPGILGELLIAALNINAVIWKSGPAATELEQVTAGWLLEWLQLPSSWFGMIVDSSCVSVLQAIVAARQRTEPEGRISGISRRLVVYVSEHTHSSIEKAALAAGIGQSNVRHIPADAQFRMRADVLATTIQSDLAKNLLPFFAVATVGTTSSTAIDPVSDIATICREHRIWLHVDAAYGGSFGIVPECRPMLDGVEHADSLVVNPHKMLMVPLDCSVFYTRHPQFLRQAFALQAEYLKTDAVDAVDFMDYGLAVGRRFRALKLWFVMRYFGRDGLITRLREILGMAAWLAEKIGADSRFEVITAGVMGLICFRLRQGDDATRALMHRINRSGRFFVSHTVLDGKFTIRVAVGNIRTEQSDIEELWKAIGDL